MKNQTITKEEFLKLTLSQISQVYSGKRDCCRCGCGGDYAYTSYHKDASTNLQIKPNDKLIEKRLARAKKLISEGVDVDYGDTYVDVKTGEDRTLTFYFDDVVPKGSVSNKAIRIEDLNC